MDIALEECFCEYVCSWVVVVVEGGGGVISRVYCSEPLRCPSRL